MKFINGDMIVGFDEDDYSTEVIEPEIFTEMNLDPNFISTITEYVGKEKYYISSITFSDVAPVSCLSDDGENITIETVDITGSNGNKHNRVKAVCIINDEGYYCVSIFPMNSATKLIAPEDCSNLFQDMGSIENIDFYNLDTSNVTNMSHMFDGCYLLKHISDLYTNSCVDASYMFANCPLEDYWLDGDEDLDFCNCENMERMFSECGLSFKNFASRFKTSNKLTNVKEMFSGCHGITELDLCEGEFDPIVTTNVTSFYRMFYNCAQMKKLAFSFNVTNAVSIEGMFRDCIALEAIYADYINGTPGICLFTSNGYSNNITKMNSVFMNCESLKDETIQEVMNLLDTSNATDMSYMFSGCKSMSSVICRFDTSKVKTMKRMFAYCDNITSDSPAMQLCDTSSLEDISGMYYEAGANGNCAAINLSYFNTSKLTSVEECFYGCKVDRINVHGWDLSSITNHEDVFKDCKAVNYEDVCIWCDESHKETLTEWVGDEALEVFASYSVLNKEDFQSLLFKKFDYSIDSPTKLITFCHNTPQSDLDQIWLGDNIINEEKRIGEIVKAELTVDNSLSKQPKSFGHYVDSYVVARLVHYNTELQFFGNNANYVYLPEDASRLFCYDGDEIGDMILDNVYIDLRGLNASKCKSLNNAFYGNCHDCTIDMRGFKIPDDCSITNIVDGTYIARVIIDDEDLMNRLRNAIKNPDEITWELVS